MSPLIIADLGFRIDSRRSPPMPFNPPFDHAQGPEALEGQSAIRNPQCEQFEPRQSGSVLTFRDPLGSRPRSP